MKNLIKETKSFCDSSIDRLSFLSNISALINMHMEDINWVGFYLFSHNELRLGPFQGKVACEVIQIGKGVCGTSFEKKLLLNVPNVHEFPGHIACDNESNAELVIPLMHNGKVLGVLDIDSKSFNRFSSSDEEILEEVANLVAEKIDQ